MARVKGAGVDCLTLLAEVYAEAGLVERVPIPHYPHDWHLHQSEERYLNGILYYMHEVETPLPGDVVLWKFGRCFSHGAIVVNWPDVIHAYVGSAVTLENAERATWLANIGEGTERGKVRPKKFFSLWK
jgi:cell wall-associated NlpC family hydrolase